LRKRYLPPEGRTMKTFRFFAKIVSYSHRFEQVIVKNPQQINRSGLTESVPDSAIRNLQSAISLGFIGFGEAGFNLAKGLRSAGIVNLFAYDINTHTQGLGEKIQQRAEASSVKLLDSSEALASACNILFSTVTANVAMEAAKQNAAFLEARHLYADMNSVSPATKQFIEKIVVATGARFVEAAVMAAVPPHGHRVPMLLGGQAAQEFIDKFAPYGMRLEIVSGQVGAASAVKMCRSIMVKGLEALLFECALGASFYGADEKVFASLQETLPGIDLGKLAGYMIGRVVEHGERRAREMEEVAETLHEAGVEPIMTMAAVQRQEWGARLNLLEHFGGKPPQSYREVVQAIADLNNQQSDQSEDNSRELG
jgi:3-hydroxyisobutyrate dehydrogenase-like beta-hydroxyacid dehydrogenase